MTIKKAQGQTLENAGTYLPLAVFTLGQLYVTLLRVWLGEAYILINPSSNKKDESTYTRNFVYKELLALSSNNKWCQNSYNTGMHYYTNHFHTFT